MYQINKTAIEGQIAHLKLKRSWNTKPLCHIIRLKVFEQHTVLHMPVSINYKFTATVQISDIKHATQILCFPVFSTDQSP